MNPRHSITTGLVAISLTLVGVGCGGSEPKNPADAGGGPGAEAAVKEHLKALDESAEDFCKTLTDGYSKRFVAELEKNASTDVEGCPGALRAALALTVNPTFEGAPLAQKDIGKLDLKSSVVQRSGEWTATVKGPAGQAEYKLVTANGEWKIDNAQAN